MSLTSILERASSSKGLFVFALLSMFAMAGFSHANSANSPASINIVANELPPYAIKNRGRIAGKSLDLIKRAIQDIYGDEVVINSNVYSFSRAFSDVRSRPRTIALNIARNEIREPFVKWVGPYESISMALLTTKATAPVELTAKSMFDKRIVVVRGTMVTDVLNRFGVSTSKLINVTDPLSGVRMVETGRADYIAHIPASISYLMSKAEDLDSSQLKIGAELAAGEFYFALSKDFSDAEVNAIQDKIDKLLAENFYALK